MVIFVDLFMPDKQVGHLSYIVQCVLKLTGPVFFFAAILKGKN
jgi:hypothetical protein